VLNGTVEGEKRAPLIWLKLRSGFTHDFSYLGLVQTLNLSLNPPHSGTFGFKLEKSSPFSLSLLMPAALSTTHDPTHAYPYRR
jgi:hypothetical protein